MATTSNKYGRQIFLTRREIQLLRGLVELKIMSLVDDINLSEAYLEFEEPGSKGSSSYKQAIDEDRRDLELCRRLIGDDEDDDQNNNGKLWYYISSEEADGRG